MTKLLIFLFLIIVALISAQSVEPDRELRSRHNVFRHRHRHSSGGTKSPKATRTPKPKSPKATPEPKAPKSKKPKKSK